MTIINWVKFHRMEVVFVLVILIMGVFLRLYQAGEWMHFGQDEGRDAFIINDIVIGKSFPLLGPAAPNNSPDYHLGPAFYYLLAPFYWFSGSSPAGGAVAIALFAVVSIFLVYLLGRNFFGNIGGLIAAGLFSASFLMVYYGRWAWNPNLVPFLGLLVFLSLFKLAKLKDNPKNQWYLYLLAGSLAIVIQLHGTALIVLPLILFFYFFIFRPKISWQKYLLAALIVVILNLPFITYDINHEWSNLKGFWRIMTQSDSGATIGFFERIDRLFSLTKDFWQSALLHGQQSVLFVILFFGSIVFLITKGLIALKKRQKDATTILFCLWLFVPWLVFIFYKEAIPTHYFCLMFPLPFLLLAWVLTSLWKTWWLKILFVGLVLLMFSSQLVYSINLLRDLSPTGSRDSSYPITLVEMQQAVDYIIQDSQGSSYIFKSVPNLSYNRSYEYIFDQSGYKFDYENPVYEYIIVNGKGQDFKTYIDDRPILAWQQFENILVIKK